MAEVIFTPSGDEANDRQIRRRAESGELRRIANGVYVELGEPIEGVVRRNWYKIVARLVPGGVVTDRTGMKSQPWRYTSKGVPEGDAYVFMSAPRTRDTIILPGLTINIRTGAGPVVGDIPYLGTHLAGPARKFLDNLTLSRERSGPSRTVGAAEVEAALESICSTDGEEHLNHLRDLARDLAPKIEREKEFKQLDGMIGALLRTRKEKLQTKQGLARAGGNPLDPYCINRLAILATYLQSRAPTTIQNADTTPGRNAAGAFIESYFSNFIEGTEFLIQEAVEIVFEGKIPTTRPEDGRDVLGVYLELVNINSRSSASISVDEFIDEIKERHKRMMEARPSVSPGEFKKQPNKAGDTVFVAPDLVDGTIREGFKIFQSITDPFSRALFVHFMLSDIHPFSDGNGRLSRMMMTKELLSAGLSRIVVPTIYRNDYIDALRALSRRNEPSIYVRSMEFCQRVSAACSAENADAAIQMWARAYAFCEDGRHARLTMPNPALVIETQEGTPAPADYWQSLSNASSNSLNL